MKYILFIFLLFLVGCRPDYTPVDYYTSAVSYIDTADFVAEFYNKESGRGALDEGELPQLAVFDTASFLVKNTSFAREIYAERHGVIFDSLSNSEKKIAYHEDYDLSSRSDQVLLPSVGLPRFYGHSRFVLFFSPVFDNMLIAEIVPMYRYLEPCTSYLCLIRQNRSLKILFIFELNRVKQTSYMIINYE